MLSLILSELIDKKLTTAREIVELTGRSETTVYRWINGKTQPDFEDIRRLMRNLPDHAAGQAILGFFSSDLPVAIEWLSDDIELVPGVASDMNGQAFDLSLLAMECLVDVLGSIRRDAKGALLSPSDTAEALTHVEAIIRFMTLARRSLINQSESRKKAKFTGKA